MKVAVSIPDSVFERGETLARQLNVPRSRLYARALDAFAAQHSAEAITAAANALADDHAAHDEARALARVASRSVLKHSEW